MHSTTSLRVCEDATGTAFPGDKLIYSRNYVIEFAVFQSTFILRKVYSTAEFEPMNNSGFHDRKYHLGTEKMHF